METDSNRPISRLVRCRLSAKLSVWMLRDDEAFPAGVGTKWRKLSHLKTADGITTLGGAFSNHLHGLAVFAKEFGLPSIGIVRGTSVDLQNPTLGFCGSTGMTLSRVKKADFGKGRESDAVRCIIDSHPSFTYIPNGGDSQEAREAAKRIVSDIKAQLDPDAGLQVVVGSGSGTTARGVASGLGPGDACVAVPAGTMHSLDDSGPFSPLTAIPDSPQQPFWLPPPNEGFAKMTRARLLAIENFLAENNILLDPIYTSRAVMAAFHLSQNQNVETVILHSGGLQGWAGQPASEYSYGLRSAIESALETAYL